MDRNSAENISSEDKRIDDILSKLGEIKSMKEERLRIIEVSNYLNYFVF